MTRQFPLTLTLQKPFSSPFSGCSRHPGNSPTSSGRSASSIAKRMSEIFFTRAAGRSRPSPFLYNRLKPRFRIERMPIHIHYRLSRDRRQLVPPAAQQLLGRNRPTVALARVSRGEAHFVFSSPELKNVSRETFSSKAQQVAPLFGGQARIRRNLARRFSAIYQLIVNGVSMNSFLSGSQAKAAARANLPARIDITI